MIAQQQLINGSCIFQEMLLNLQFFSVGWITWLRFVVKTKKVAWSRDTMIQWVWTYHFHDWIREIIIIKSSVSNSTKLKRSENNHTQIHHNIRRREMERSETE